MQFASVLIVASLPSAAPTPALPFDTALVAPAPVISLTEIPAPAPETSLTGIPAPAPRPWAETHLAQEPPSSSGLYLRLSVGIVTTMDSASPDEDIGFDEGWLGSVGIGQRTGAATTGLGLSFELEGLYTDQDADDQGAIQALDSVTVAAGMLNGIVDFRILERLDLYGAAGIGAAWLDVDTQNSFEDEDGPFLAWQLKAGLAWRFSVSTAIHFGYRFLNIDDAEIDNGIGGTSFDLETQQHALEAGLLFGF